MWQAAPQQPAASTAVQLRVSIDLAPSTETLGAGLGVPRMSMGRERSTVLVHMLQRLNARSALSIIRERRPRVAVRGPSDTEALVANRDERVCYGGDRERERPLNDAHPSASFVKPLVRVTSCRRDWAGVVKRRELISHREPYAF